MIFDSYADIKSYIPLNIHKNTEDNGGFKANLQLNAERSFAKHFRKWLGKELMNEVKELSSASGEIDAVFLDLVKRALALLTFADSLHMIDLALTSNGFAVTSNDSLSPASRDRITALKENLQQAVNDSMSELMHYLQDNAESFDTWNRSTISEGTFVTTNEEMNSAVSGIDISPVQFFALKPALTMFRVKCNRDMTNAEMSALHGDDLSAEQTDLLTMLKRAAAYEALHHMDKEKGYAKIADEEFHQARAYMTENRETFTTYGEKYVEPHKNEAENKTFLC